MHSTDPTFIITDELAAPTQPFGNRRERRALQAAQRRQERTYKRALRNLTRGSIYGDEPQ